MAATSPQSVPRGLRLNNPLCIRRGSSWQGLAASQPDPEFCAFDELVFGLRAGFRIIRKYMRSRPPYNTVRQIIRRWAPPSENDTASYIRSVCRLTGLPPDREFSFSDKKAVCALVYAMCQVECGLSVPYGEVERAYFLASS